MVWGMGCGFVTDFHGISDLYHGGKRLDKRTKLGHGFIVEFGIYVMGKSVLIM